MTDKENKIKLRLLEDLKTVEDMGHEVVGVFLQGSQNYELDYEGSDIDTKAIVLPKFNDFVLNRKSTSATHVLPSNEHIDLKDIRLMFDCFKKQNINFIEILFTKYMMLNPKYEKLFQPMLDNKEKIARYNNYQAVNCMSGMSMEKYKALEHPYPTLIDKIEKFGYDGKQLSHELRLAEFLPRFINGELYSNCLISKQRDYLIRVKCNEEYTLEEARILAKETLDYITNLKNEYMQNYELKVDKEVEELLNNVLVNIMKHNFKTELGI